MSSVQDEAKARLEGERAELAAMIEQLTADAGAGTDDEEMEGGSLADTLRETLKDIEDALSKLANGTFGTCETCKGKISDERLAEMPAAKLCYDCADAESSVITGDPDID